MPARPNRRHSSQPGSGEPHRGGRHRFPAAGRRRPGPRRQLEQAKQTKEIWSSRHVLNALVNAIELPRQSPVNALALDRTGSEIYWVEQVPCWGDVNVYFPLMTATRNGA